MNENTKYILRVIDESEVELEGILQKYVETDDSVDVYFKITNNIEELANKRSLEFEVVWDSYYGFMIPIETLKLDNDINYVTIIKYAKNEEIPVYVKTRNDSYAIVRNYSTEELQELEIESEYTLRLYDRIIIENK